MTERIIAIIIREIWRSAPIVACSAIAYQWRGEMADAGFVMLVVLYLARITEALESKRGA